MLKKENNEFLNLFEGIRDQEEALNHYVGAVSMLGLEKNFCEGIVEGTLNQVANSNNILKEVQLLIQKSAGGITEVKDSLIYLTDRVVESGIQFSNMMFKFKSSYHSLEDFNSVAKEVLNVSEQKLNLDYQTPYSVNQLMISLLNPVEGSIYDGAMGLGNTLLLAGEYARSHGKEIQLYGQELMEILYHLGVVKAYILGFDPTNFAKGDVLKQPEFLKADHQLKQFDYVAMNFPFGLRDEDGSLMKNEKYGRLLYGTPSRVGVDYLFIAHTLLSLNERGKAAVIVPNGTLFRTNSDARIRGNLVTADVIEAVIALPEQLFSNTSIQTNLIIFNKNKEEARKNKILFINAEKLYEVKGRRQRVMALEHLNQIQHVFETYSEQEEFSKIVSSQQLKDYNLLPSEYIVKRVMKIEGYGQVSFDLKKIMEASNGVTMGIIGHIYRGVSVMGRHEPVADGEFKLINLADVQDGEIIIDQLLRYNFSANTRTDNYLVQEGDLIISSRGAQIKIAIVPKHEGKILLSQNFIGIRLQSGIYSKFLKTYLESPVGQYLLEQKLTGSNILTLTPRQLMEIPVVLPTLEAQFQMINEYEQQKVQLEQQIKQLEAQKKEQRLELFEKMGLSPLMTVEQTI